MLCSLRMRESERRDAAGRDATASAEAAPSPGKSTLIEGAATRGGSGGLVVQRRASDEGAAAASPVAVAEAATSGSGGQLPHLDRVQSLFGRHDVSNIRAHQGAAAEEGAAQLGARAFAVGDAVAFRGSPDLHTASPT